MNINQKTFPSISFIVKRNNNGMNLKLFLENSTTFIQHNRSQIKEIIMKGASNTRGTNTKRCRWGLFEWFDEIIMSIVKELPD